MIDLNRFIHYTASFTSSLSDPGPKDGRKENDRTPGAGEVYHSETATCESTMQPNVLSTVGCLSLLPHN